MKKRFLIVALYLTTVVVFSQNKIQINTSNNRLLMHQLKETTNAYLVYFQDSLTGPKYNMELWERSLKKQGNKFQFNWNRFFSDGSMLNYEIEVNTKNFAPLKETIIIHKKETIDKRYFTYNNGTISTHKDSNLHNGKPFRMDGLGNSFNWELDMETFSMLPLDEGKTFAINFYHPGSQTPPKYYNYKVVRSESLLFLGKSYNCWVLKVEYPQHGSSEFWIDEQTFQTLQMKEIYDGKYRFKKIIIQ